MQVQSDIRSQSKKGSRFSQRRKRKEAINDPTIKKEYEEIEQFLSKILSETHLPEAQDPRNSAATFQQFPGVNTLRIPAQIPADESQMSIPLFDNFKPLNNESPEGQNRLKMQSHSTTDLEIKEAKTLKRKAADMLLRNNVQDDIEEFKYDERAEEAQRQLQEQQRLTSQNTEEDQLH